jgi:hypothetical protein
MNFISGSSNIKIRIFKTMSKPVVMNGRKTLTIIKKDEVKLNVWERGIMRKEDGLITEEGV